MDKILFSTVLKIKQEESNYVIKLANNLTKIIHKEEPELDIDPGFTNEVNRLAKLVDYIDHKTSFELTKDGLFVQNKIDSDLFVVATILRLMLIKFNDNKTLFISYSAEKDHGLNGRYGGGVIAIRHDKIEDSSTENIITMFPYLKKINIAFIKDDIGNNTIITDSPDKIDSIIIVDTSKPSNIKFNGHSGLVESFNYEFVDSQRFRQMSYAVKHFLKPPPHK